MTITYKSRADETQSLARRPALRALVAGFRMRCPNCQQGKLLKDYLKVVDHCAVCGEAFHHQRADDAPAYFTVLITGHIVLPVMLQVLTTTNWPTWVHLMVWPSLAIALMGLLLPRIKGALVALQWALRMHGFQAVEDTN